MGYDIYIGNAEIDDLEEGYRLRVNQVRLSDAPTFPGDEMTGDSNGRHPGYLGWGDFCNKACLDGLFFDKDEGLMRRHPGIVALKESHSHVIEHSLAKWKESHPNAKPGFDSINYDHVLARLIWLNFWVKWALTNCKRPAIWNY